MKIKKSDLNTKTPPKERIKYGYTNVVLAVWKDSNYCESNTYIPKWQVVNTVYYNTNKDNYEGWIDLEYLIPPVELQ